jgi:hypothetical protein
MADAAAAAASNRFAAIPDPTQLPDPSYTQKSHPVSSRSNSTANGYVSRLSAASGRRWLYTRQDVAMDFETVVTSPKNTRTVLPQSGQGSRSSSSACWK